MMMRMLTILLIMWTGKETVDVGVERVEVEKEHKAVLALEEEIQTQDSSKGLTISQWGPVWHIYRYYPFLHPTLPSTHSTRFWTFCRPLAFKVAGGRGSMRFVFVCDFVRVRLYC
jgi:hypothetical protein